MRHLTGRTTEGQTMHLVSEAALVDAMEAARRLGLSHWTIYHWARSGQLPSIKLGRRRLFRPLDLESFIEMRRIPDLQTRGSPPRS
jgi:excisionase family DNA binding protein